MPNEPPDPKCFAISHLRPPSDWTPRPRELECRPQYLLGMSHRNVENLIGRLATDPVLRRRFAEDPAAVLRELAEQGFELTAIEADALKSTDIGPVRLLADSLDRRIKRAEPVRGEEDADQS